MKNKKIRVGDIVTFKSKITDLMLVVDFVVVGGINGVVVLTHQNERRILNIDWLKRYK